MTHICVIDGHPDPAEGHFVSALVSAYVEGARAGGHSVETVRVADLGVALLQAPSEFGEAPTAEIAGVQNKIANAEHVVMVFPLWLGTMPAICKAFWEQIARSGFLLDTGGGENKWPLQKMKGKSARIIVTMGMPGFAYRLFFGAHSVKGLEAGIFRISGFKPVKHTIFGGVEGENPEVRIKMLEATRALGRKAA